MRVSIIGAGLQAMRRGPVVVGSNEDVLVSVSSKSIDDARNIARIFSCEYDDSWRVTVARRDVEAVIICTPPSSHFEIAEAAMSFGKHVLCEKPLSMDVNEATKMVNIAEKEGVVFKCGFNHRHHPAISRAKKIVDSGKIGGITFIRSVYGICGRSGYESEWRADPAQAAGGQLIEQGTHLIDLIRWFGGEIAEITCMNSIHHFKKQPLEDDSNVIMRLKSGATASIHTSLVQWKNLFRFEVFGNKGYVICEGLGGSYGEEKLITGGADFRKEFQDNVTYFRAQDISWKDEWIEFTDAIKNEKEPLGSVKDGLRAMEISIAAYSSDKLKSHVSLN